MARTRRELLIDGSRVAAAAAVAGALAPTGPVGIGQALAAPGSKLRRPGFNLAFKSLEEETFLQIITGAKSVDDFDAFVEEWNAGGGAALLEKMNQ